VRALDVIRFAFAAALGNRLRTLLSMLAMGIGVAAVVVLTALGDGARHYVIDQFSSLGTNLVIVLPGRTQTGGFSPANAVTSTPRDLTLDDARAIGRAQAVLRVAPASIGSAEISAGGRLRVTIVVGTTAEYQQVRHLELAQGRFLPDEDWAHGSPVMVIGGKVKRELFGADAAVGQLVRVGDRRFRIIGVLSTSGMGLGLNTDELAFVPVSIAQQMFNTNSLFRILVEARHRDVIALTKAQARDTLKARHEGEEDVTVITQDAVLATFDRVLGTLTLGVAGIAAISLAVAGILVMNVMLVSVTQRTPEIGLLKALGASAGAIRATFLTEAALLSAAGGLLGFALGQAGAALIRYLYPTYPAFAPGWAVLAGLGTSIVTGLVFGVLPARRAARMDPVQALAKR
jgi:putative ABC transport system permease protein